MHCLHVDGDFFEWIMLILHYSLCWCTSSVLISALIQKPSREPVYIYRPLFGQNVQKMVNFKLETINFTFMAEF